MTLTDHLRRDVDVLAGLIGPRHTGAPSALAAAAAHVRRALEDAGHAVTAEPVMAGADNLIAEVPGESGRVVVVGAHYDTVPETPGADDNASAVAVLLAVARDLGRRPKHTVRLVAFVNEEPPHYKGDTMGSLVHANNCRQRGDDLLGMLCLEMIGYFNDSPGSQSYPPGLPWPIRKLLPDRGDFLSLVGDLASRGLIKTLAKGFRQATDLPLKAFPLPSPIVGQTEMSDHWSFKQHGYPAAMACDTSFFRNPHYHQPTDLPGTLDYKRLTEVARGIIGAVELIAGPTSAA
jgi:Zn-dependent M28 family amino/carboxypeptidase